MILLDRGVERKNEGHLPISVRDRKNSSLTSRNRDVSLV